MSDRVATALFLSAFILFLSVAGFFLVILVVDKPLFLAPLGLWGVTWLGCYIYLGRKK